MVAKPLAAQRMELLFSALFRAHSGRGPRWQPRQRYFGLQFGGMRWPWPKRINHTFSPAFSEWLSESAGFIRRQGVVLTSLANLRMSRSAPDDASTFNRFRA
jgi:hypothetical protein